MRIDFKFEQIVENDVDRRLLASLPDGGVEKGFAWLDLALKKGHEREEEGNSKK